MAKALPFLTAVYVSVFFGLIWFPTNVVAYFFGVKERKYRLQMAQIFVVSGLFFAVGLYGGWQYFCPLLFHKIHFHVKLVDQRGIDVAGATINIRIYGDWKGAGPRKEYSLETDTNGFFDVVCRFGESFTFKPLAPGYVLSSTYVGGAYSEELWATQKDILPTLIKMWKLQGAEPLVNIGKEYKLPFTGAPFFFDLIAGMVVPAGGDFKITVNRPAGEVSQHNPQKWSIDFEVVDGGFIDTSSEESAITFAAPYGDYEPRGVFGNNNGTDGLDKYFFIQSRNGQVFSKLYLSMGINNKPEGSIYITFRGAANTNGSRNWEATVPK
jgi:hypothetical protein